MKTLASRFRRILRPPAFPQNIRDWETFYGRPRPKVAALLASAVGGSHFALHRLQGHPNLLALEERILSQDLKAYFNFGDFPVRALAEHQLLPAKRDLSGVEWLILNKPALDFVAYHIPFHRHELRLFQLVRNPMALYYSRLRGWQEMAERDYGGRQAAPEHILKWTDGHLLSEYSSFAHFHDAALDRFVNLEALTLFPDENLPPLFGALGVPALPEASLAHLTHCETCGRALGVRPASVKSGTQEALYCSHCDRTYTAAGGYNYIRTVEPDELASWKSKPGADELQAHFAQLLGREFMDYFVEERYRQPDGRQRFEAVFSELLGRLGKGLTD